MKYTITIFTAILSFFILTTNSYATNIVQPRAFYSVSVHGTSRVVPESTVIRLCADFDGCVIRMGMRNYDSSGRTASRESLFYYNKYKRTWRASRSDKRGTNDNNVTQHVMQAWTCYFTDGAYRRFVNKGDFTRNFALLAWKSYRSSTCEITIID